MDADATSVLAVLRWIGIDADAHLVSRLLAYGRWLVQEALPAGGIGPHERNRVMQRHVADSLTFAAGFHGARAGRLIDVGSGVGLPGIPLAMAFPELEITLLDRSGRRVDLAQRAVRVLGLTNVSVVQGDAADVEPGWDLVTMRAVLPGASGIDLVRRLVRRGGVGVIGASRVEAPVPAAGERWGSDVEIIAIPGDVLDSPGWLLRIRP